MTHSGEVHPVRGADVSDLNWEKALRQAMRTPFVVQEATEPTRAVFPMLQYGSLMMKEMLVNVQPHAYLGDGAGLLKLAGHRGSGVVLDAYRPGPNVSFGRKVDPRACGSSKGDFTRGGRRLYGHLGPQIRDPGGGAVHPSP